MPDSNIEWKLWGKRDPLWAVASWKGREKTGRNPWTEKEFYELGAQDWNDFITHWKKYGADSNFGLEIGCGAGRITRHMAGFFKRVHAIDVSEGMLGVARKNIDRPNVEFHLVKGSEIPLADCSVTGVFSSHVFQHIEGINAITAYFKEIFRVLAENGTAMIHVPVHEWPIGMNRWLRRFHAADTKLKEIQVKSKRKALEKGKGEPFIRTNSYPIEYFFKTLPEIGFKDIEIGIFLVKSNCDPHPFIFARKRAP